MKNDLGLYQPVNTAASRLGLLSNTYLNTYLQSKCMLICTA